MAKLLRFFQFDKIIFCAYLRKSASSFMVVHIKTVGTLKSLEEGTGLVSIEVPEQTPVSKVIERLNLQAWEIGFILINGTRATKESILKDQDHLTLIAPLVGG